MIHRLLATFALTAISLLWPASADACSCAPPGLPCDAAWNADAVFVGHVISISSSVGRRVELAVTESFRGLQLSQVTLVTGSGGGDCGYPFEMGQSYFVYAHRTAEGQLSTSICARTRPLRDAVEDLAYARSPWPSAAGSLGRLRATAVSREVDFASLDAEVKPDGTFQFANLYGLRRIQAMALPFNWTIRAVEAPGNLMVGQNLDIKPGSMITNLRVIVTNRVGRLMTTVADENGQDFTTGSVLLMSRDRTELDALGWGFRATQMNYGIGSVSYYTMDRILPGTYLAVAIDVEPYRLTNDADLMERARAAATSIEVGQGETSVKLRLVRLRPFVLNTADQ